MPGKRLISGGNTDTLRGDEPRLETDPSDVDLPPGIGPPPGIGIRPGICLPPPGVPGIVGGGAGGVCFILAAKNTRRRACIRRQTDPRRVANPRRTTRDSIRRVTDLKRKTDHRPETDPSEIGLPARTRDSPPEISHPWLSQLVLQPVTRKRGRW